MEPHRVVTHDEWIAARKAYLAEEKAFSRARDALSELGLNPLMVEAFRERTILA